VTHDEFFERATGQKPYPYQRALGAAAVFPEVLVAPTGAGKTATVVLGWLYRRRFAPAAVRKATPRRLVFCLPMRTLVSQAQAAIRGWLERVDLLEAGRRLDRGDRVGVHVIMGGDIDDDWHLHPERDAVIIGTQDMLLSRALNRGYGQNRFAWPWHHGLLSNDSLWAFDEVQLMGVGLTTGLQLSALRRSLGTFGPSASLYMSATLSMDWLTTVDHPRPERTLTLSRADLADPALAKRRRASKQLHKAATRMVKEFARALAEEVLSQHVEGSRTIVVLNTVDKARELREALACAGKREASPEVVLLHSRFRPLDRQAALVRATGRDFAGIVVSTQVIEAGVDMSSRTLFTELAPWASLVQRAGRCNRAGEYREADVYWVDHPDDDPKTALPYEAEALIAARKQIKKMSTFNPHAIEEAGVEAEMPSPTHVLRRKDVIDLFDTTPDLGGVDIDVSRFIREGEERDAQVFWRDVAGSPVPGEPRPRREELCSVPFLQLRQFAEDAARRVWRWDHLEREWERVRGTAIIPGGVYLLDAAAGGYLPEEGWRPLSRDPVLVLPHGSEREEAIDDDPDSDVDRPVTLGEHSLDARNAAQEIVHDLACPDLPGAVVERAAQAHDHGKAHPVFQDTMRRSGNPDTPHGTLWAKSARLTRHRRTGFRHELASALAWLQLGDDTERDLIAYLLAAHHGKVRLSLRALPGEQAPPEPGRLYARGIWDGETLPACDLGEGLKMPETVLSVAPMQLGAHDGAPSWSARVLVLRDRFGPFRLAYLEMLVRAADVRATLREKRP
jgi:CRISPR-associated endonuclease/helicase Cas3